MFPCMKQPAAVYIRVSREESGDRKLSPAQQEHDGRALLKKRKFIVPPGMVFSDIDISGKFPPAQYAESPRQKTPYGQKTHRSLTGRGQPVRD